MMDNPDGKACEITLKDVVEILQCKVLVGEDALDTRISIVGASDMMSDVLAFSRSGFLLLTGQVNGQVVRTADIAEAHGVVIVRNKAPSDEALQLARDIGMPLFCTHMLMFEACGRLFEKQLKPC